MGKHRGEPSVHESAAPPQPYVGRRRAAGPVDATPPSTPYVGRRCARPVLDVPLLSEVDAQTDTQTLPVVASVTTSATAGRRRASRTTRGPRSGGARGPLFRALPSTPALLGVAVLAVATGGALTLDGPQLASHQTSTIHQASAQTGADATTPSGATRSTSLNRDANRQALRQADGATPAATAATRQAFRQHDAAVSQLSQQAQHQSARLNDNRWITPIPAGSYVLTARFGETGLWQSYHTGLDFAAPTGTPIHAVSSGVITETGWAGSYGNRTIETLPDGTEIWYCHQSEIGVTTGQTITRDEQIGLVGATGNVTGPHVHIEVRPDAGDPVDPFPAFVQHGITP